MHIYISTQNFGTGTKVIRRKHIVQPQVSAPVPRPVVKGMERMCQRHGSDQPPTLLSESKNHVSINSYSIIYAVEEFLLWYCRYKKSNASLSYWGTPMHIKELSVTYSGVSFCIYRLQKIMKCPSWACNRTGLRCLSWHPVDVFMFRSDLMAGLYTERKLIISAL